MTGCLDNGAFNVIPIIMTGTSAVARSVKPLTSPPASRQICPKTGGRRRRGGLGLSQQNQPRKELGTHGSVK